MRSPIQGWAAAILFFPSTPACLCHASPGSSPTLLCPLGFLTILSCVCKHYAQLTDDRVVINVTVLVMMEEDTRAGCAAPHSAAARSRPQLQALLPASCTVSCLALCFPTSKDQGHWECCDISAMVASALQPHRTPSPAPPGVADTSHLILPQASSPAPLGKRLLACMTGGGSLVCSLSNVPTCLFSDQTGLYSQPLKKQSLQQEVKGALNIFHTPLISVGHIVSG